MRKFNIQLAISEEILFILKKDEKDLQKEILKILAMQFFMQKKLSLGKAAEMAEMDKNDFIQLLGENNIDIYRYTKQELDKEMSFINQLSEK